MILHFESNLQFQIDAISSVIHLFDGQPKDGGHIGFFAPEELIKNAAKAVKKVASVSAPSISST